MPHVAASTSHPIVLSHLDFLGGGLGRLSCSSKRCRRTTLLCSQDQASRIQMGRLDDSDQSGAISPVFRLVEVGQDAKLSRC